MFYSEMHGEEVTLGAASQDAMFLRLFESRVKGEEKALKVG